MVILLANVILQNSQRWKDSFPAKISGSCYGVPSEIKWLVLPVVAAWVLALCLPSVRNAYAHGWRCVGRHAVLWKLPAGLTFAYGLFQMGDLLLLHYRIGRIPDTSPVLGKVPPEPLQVAFAAILPASEWLAAALNCLVTTFPFSVLCGVLFFTNHNGLTGELAYALSKQFGNWAWLFLAAIASCAFASVVKPITLVLLPEMAQILSPRELVLIASAINMLSFAFEYLLGTCFQVYLVLIAYGWVRGLNFRRGRILHFAVRRMGFVLKWAVVIILATFALIHFPLFAEAWVTGDPVSWSTLAVAGALTRPALAGIMLALATVQIRLTLHNVSLRAAIRAHGQFLKRYGFHFLVFLLAALSLFFLLQALQQAGSAWLVVDLWRYSWTILIEIVGACSVGWILAAFVCFYKTCEGGAKGIPF
jgi:hypothetical protein